MRFLEIYLVILLFVGVLGCKDEAEPKGEEETATTEETSSPEAPSEKPPSKEATEEDHEEAHHGEEATPAVSDAPLDVSLGDPLTDAPTVSIEELMSAPEEHEGKKVRITGPVVDQCHHARGWFAIGSTKSDKVIRLITAPKFKVSKGAVGSKSVAEGTVVLKTLDPSMVKHYAAIHSFIPKDMVDEDGPITLPCVTCSGATFSR